jgi:hypothetical protein
MTLKRDSAMEAWILAINCVLEDLKNKVAIHKYIYSPYQHA